MKKRTHTVAPLNADFIAELQAQEDARELRPCLTVVASPGKTLLPGNPATADVRRGQMQALVDYKPCPAQYVTRVTPSGKRRKRSSGVAPRSVRGLLPGVYTEASLLASMLLTLDPPEFRQMSGVLRAVMRG